MELKDGVWYEIRNQDTSEDSNYVIRDIATDTVVSYYVDQNSNYISGVTLYSYKSFKYKGPSYSTIEYNWNSYFKKENAIDCLFRKSFDRGVK